MTSTYSNNRLADILARAEIFRRLATIFNYPDDELNQDLRSGIFISTLTDALKTAGLDSACAKLDPGSILEDWEELLALEKDYTRMCFASKPRQVYLFESVYREGKLLQESTFQIAGLYYEAGLQLTETFTLPPDHIAVELEFMAFLYFKEAEAIQEGSSAKESLALRLQGEVLQNHLIPFGLSVAERMEKYATTRFYRTMACILRSVLESLAEPSDAKA
ncbi:chaperone TorD involved in molybdoenzyme TorA maturation [Syntrophus gentianae]|uniref:Chaperone TorD involved in molybdoenzyme TorA maturation n=1 Tax=Syntrophus gentianae TaxID=43775 RepID=A0A1H7WT37_9BACT|nr:molecular chaperone TorD family protein [Syntrophus gentianae]SEM24077.1 chaperone TorD involved in molybdoenzyme TorA maturation [Syntrophus gentianae]